jgi:branched-chain amino acid aminotransferase
MGHDRANEGVAFIDGKYVPVAEAGIPILDWGFLRSDATYDVVHVWKGRFFRLTDHLDRFERGMKELHLELPYTRQEIARILTECVRKSGLRDAYVEMICTRGIPPTGSRDLRQCVNRFYAFAIPFVWVANPEQRVSGLRLVISSTRRIPATSVDPTVKNYHWLDFVRGLWDAYERGGDTTVLTDAENNVVEGPGFNIFAMEQGRIWTPGAGMLEGITRKTVIELCEELDLPFTIGPLPAERLRNADEAFVTSTAGGILWVATVDGVPLSGGAPGPVTRRLHDLYWSRKEGGWHGTVIEYG